MTPPRQQIIQLIEQGAIPADKIPAALAAARVAPGGASWRRFLDHLLLWLGGMALAFAAMFFIAYNWHELGRFAKFGLAEALIILAIAAYWKLGDTKVSGKVSLLMATIFLGVLLALYGQTYQTGADPWQLFGNWALLMLPWAVIGRFPAIWIVWLVLVNLTVVLYYRTFGGIFGLLLMHDTDVLWLLFAVNTVALALWETLSRPLCWLSERWAVRLAALGSGIPVTWLALFAIFDPDISLAATALVWVASLAGFYFVYRRVWYDLFMLAGCSLSTIVVVIAFLSRHMLDEHNAGSFLMLSMLTLGMGTFSAFWLRKIHQEEQE